MTLTIETKIVVSVPQVGQMEDEAFAQASAHVIANVHGLTEYIDGADNHHSGQFRFTFRTI